LVGRRAGVSFYTDFVDHRAHSEGNGDAARGIPPLRVSVVRCRDTSDEEKKHISARLGSLSLQRFRRRPIVADIEEAPLDRARAKRDQIELELKKCPDFQLYLLTRSIDDRMRMEQLLDQNPRFRLWRVLAGSIGAVDERVLREESAEAAAP
jgi:hypothetical protein